MVRTLTRPHRLALAALFGAMCAYIAYGALTGHLYLPARRGPGLVLSGAMAWACLLVPVSFYLSILFRCGLFPSLPPWVRACAEWPMLALGAAVMAGVLVTAWDLRDHPRHTKHQSGAIASDGDAHA